MCSRIALLGVERIQGNLRFPEPEQEQYQLPWLPGAEKKVNEVRQGGGRRAEVITRGGQKYNRPVRMTVMLGGLHDSCFSILLPVVPVTHNVQ